MIWASKTSYLGSKIPWYHITIIFCLRCGHIKYNSLKQKILQYLILLKKWQIWYLFPKCYSKLSWKISNLYWQRLLIYWEILIYLFFWFINISFIFNFAFVLFQSFKHGSYFIYIIYITWFFKFWFSLKSEAVPKQEIEHQQQHQSISDTANSTTSYIISYSGDLQQSIFTTELWGYKQL